MTGGAVAGDGHEVDWTLPGTNDEYTITCAIEDEHGLAANETASLIKTVFGGDGEPGYETTGPDGQKLVLGALRQLYDGQGQH